MRKRGEIEEVLKFIQQQLLKNPDNEILQSLEIALKWVLFKR